VAQLALAWVLAMDGNIIAIPGTTNEKRLQENTQAGTITLTKEELDAIEVASPRGVAAGERYPSRGMKMVDR
jgi:aryl-alcohol dehydrogenase-like predicted oxidoreductase